ncbi:universal stress protein [Methanolobus sp. ZRKC2]|uniref:universal stress protein n=1 Tax=Methanolobus sp. ZRKC2 TaxID=3125783 RepID=UPI00324D2BD5
MKVKIKKILIATDGSENVKNAVDWGIQLAKLNDAKVSALYVFPHASVTIGMRGEMWAKGLNQHLREEGNRAVEYVVDMGKKEGIEVEPVIIEGEEPTNGIMNFAAENDIDIIVMGTLGKTGFEHILLGSVAENVIRHAKKQVLVVP